MFIHTIRWEGNNVDISKVTSLKAVCYGFIVALSIYILLWIVELIQIGYNWMWKI
jgi:hypothetical protein